MDDKIKQNIFDNTLSKSFWIGLTDLLHIEEEIGTKNDLKVNPEVQETLIAIFQFPDVNN